MASNCSSAGEVHPNKLVVKVWETFANAASSLCQLYKGKIDRCTDLQSLLETLSSIERFYQASQKSLEASLSHGKSVGSKYLRLHLRDLAYRNVQTAVAHNGLEVYVPLESLLIRNQERYHGTSNLPRKRPNHCAYCPRRSKRIALHHCDHRRSQCRRSKKKASLFPVSSTISTDKCLYNVVEDLSGDDTVGHEGDIIGSINCNSEAFTPTMGSLPNHPAVSKLVLDGLSQGRKRRHLFPPSYQTGSCNHNGNNYNESIDHDPFDDFQDAVQVINLLDPLSRFSVTSKRQRIGTPTSPRSDSNII
ncbi:unnamed protein product [Trichobilharzia szidati]|nr:unnamed protein product [Trichobilharzia szidati]